MGDGKGTARQAQRIMDGNRLTVESCSRKWSDCDMRWTHIRIRRMRA